MLFSQYYLGGVKAVFVLSILYFVLYAYWKKTASNTIYIYISIDIISENCEYTSRLGYDVSENDKILPIMY